LSGFRKFGAFSSSWRKRFDDVFVNSIGNALAVARDPGEEAVYAGGVFVGEPALEESFGVAEEALGPDEFIGE